jgi:hypothetical protein
MIRLTATDNRFKENTMNIKHKVNGVEISGPKGTIFISDDDEIGQKLCMLIEGECSSESRIKVAQKYGYSKQRYFQLRKEFIAGGTAKLVSGKRGPKRRYRRTGEVTRQIIRYRFLDHKASPEIIGQKLRQDGWKISNRSVTRVITEYGLQKKGFTNAGLAANLK